MDLKIGKKTETTQDQGNSGDKGRQNVLLLVLLILVGGAAYLYFFTDMIKPQNVAKPVEVPVSQVVKKPLPPREGEAAKSELPAAAPKQEAVIPAKPEPAKPAQAVPVAKAPAAAAPTAPTAPTAAATAAKPKVKDEPRKVEAAKVATVKKETAVKKEAAKPARKSAVAVAGPSGRWTLLVGSYVIESNLSADLAKVKKAGLEPVIKPGARKKSTMNRLLVAEYTDRAAAKAELAKLGKYTSDAFVIDHGGRHNLYAGSYILDSRASSEKERLAAAGYTLRVQRIEVAIPSKSLTAGIFSDRKAADAALKKLRAAGLKATLIGH